MKSNMLQSVGLEKKVKNPVPQVLFLVTWHYLTMGFGNEIF